jgi:hypothetical protein
MGNGKHIKSMYLTESLSLTTESTVEMWLLYPRSGLAESWGWELLPTSWWRISLHIAILGTEQNANFEGTHNGTCLQVQHWGGWGSRIARFRLAWATLWECVSKKMKNYATCEVQFLLKMHHFCTIIKSKY